MFAPPYTPKTRVLMYFESFSISETTCKTNSRVGTNTKTLGCCCLENGKSCKIGIMYANVFPVPVCAIPTTSFPDLTTENACSCMGVVFTKPKSSIAYCN